MAKINDIFLYYMTQYNIINSSIVLNTFFPHKIDILDYSNAIKAQYLVKR